VLLVVPPLHELLVIEHAALAAQADEVRGVTVFTVTFSTIPTVVTTLLYRPPVR